MSRMNLQLNPHLDIRPELERCLCCGSKAPTSPGAELCTQCARAQRYLEPVGKVGRCRVCQEFSDLYRSFLREEGFEACETHTILATLRELPTPCGRGQAKCTSHLKTSFLNRKKVKSCEVEVGDCR